MNLRCETIWSRTSLVRFSLLFALALVLCANRAFAIDSADVAFTAPNIDLLPHFAGLETGLREVPIERPDQMTGTKDFMTLHAKGPGPKFYWVAAGFKNSASEARAVVAHRRASNHTVQT